MVLKIKNNKTIVLDLSKGHGAHLSESDFASNADEIASGGKFLSLRDIYGTGNAVEVNLIWDDEFDFGNKQVTWKPFYSPDAGNFGEFMGGLTTFTAWAANVYIDIALTGSVQPSTIMHYVKTEMPDLYQDYGPEVELLVTILCSVKPVTEFVPDQSGVGFTEQIVDWDWGAALNSQTLRDALKVVAPNVMHSEMGDWINAIITSLDQGDISPLINQTLQQIPWIDTAVAWINGLNDKILDYLVLDNVEDWLADKIKSELKFSVGDIPALAKLHNQYSSAIGSDPYNTQLNADVFRQWIQEKINTIPSASIEYDQNHTPIIVNDNIGTWNILSSANNWIWNFFESQAGTMIVDSIITFAVDKAVGFISDQYTNLFQEIGAWVSGVDLALVPTITNIEITDNLGNRITSSGTYRVDGSFDPNVTTKEFYGDYIDMFIFDKDKLIFNAPYFSNNIRDLQYDEGLHLGNIINIKVEYLVAEYGIGFGVHSNDPNHISYGSQDFLLKLSDLNLGGNDKIVLDVIDDAYGEPETLGDEDKLKITSPDNANIDTGGHLNEISKWQSSDKYVTKNKDKVLVDIMNGQGIQGMRILGEGPELQDTIENLQQTTNGDFYYLKVESIKINGHSYNLRWTGSISDEEINITREISKVIHFEDRYAGADNTGKLAIMWDKLDSLMKYLDIEVDEDGVYEFNVGYSVTEVYENSSAQYGDFTTYFEVDFDYQNFNYANSDIIDYDETLTVGADTGTLYHFDNHPAAGDQDYGSWGKWGEDSNGKVRVEITRNTWTDDKFFDNVVTWVKNNGGLTPINVDAEITPGSIGVWFNTTRDVGGRETKTLDSFYVKVNGQEFLIDNRNGGKNLAIIVPSPEPDNIYKEDILIDKEEIIRVLKDEYGIVLHDGLDIEINLTYVVAFEAIVGFVPTPYNPEYKYITNESHLSLTLKGEGVQKVLMANSELVKVNYSDNSATYDANVTTKDINELASEINPEYSGNPVANNPGLVTVDVLANDLNTTLVSQIEFVNDTDNFLSQITLKFSDGRADLTLTGDNLVYIQNNKIVINNSVITNLIPNFDKGLIVKTGIDYVVLNPTQVPSAATLEYVIQAEGVPFRIEDEEITMKEKDGAMVTSPVLAHNVGPDVTRVHIYKNDTKGLEFQSLELQDDVSPDAGYQVVAHVHKVFSNGAQDFDVVIDGGLLDAIKLAHLGNDQTKYYIDINRKEIIAQIEASNPQLGAWKINDGDTVTLDIKYGAIYKDAFGQESYEDAILKVNILGQSDILPLKANNEHVSITEETHDINADVYNDPNFQDQIAWYDGDNLVVDVRANDSTQNIYDTVNVASQFIQGNIWGGDANGNSNLLQSFNLDYSDLEAQGIIFVNSNNTVEVNKLALIDYLGIDQFVDGSKIEFDVRYYLTSSALIDVQPTPQSNTATLKVTIDGDGTYTAVTDADETISLHETNNIIGQFTNIAEYVSNDVVKIDLSKNTVYQNAVLEDYQITYITAKFSKAGQVVDVDLPQSVFQQIISGNKFYLQANKTEIIAKIMEEINNNPAFANLSSYDKDFNTSDNLEIKVGYKLSTNSITDNYSPTDESILTINVNGRDRLIIDESEEIILKENDTSIISSTVIEADGSLINPGVDVSYLQNAIQNAIKVEVADNATLSGAVISGLVITNCVASVSQAGGSLNGFFVLDDSFYDVHTGANGTYITLNKNKIISLAAGGQFNFHAGDKIEITVNYDLTAQTASSGGVLGLTETMVDHSSAKIIIEGEGGPISITGEEDLIINELPSGYGDFSQFGEHVWEIVNGTLNNVPSITRVLNDPLDDDIDNISSLLKFEVFDGNKLKLSAVDPDRLAQILDKGAFARYSFKLAYGGVEKTVTININGKADSILPVQVTPMETLNDGNSITINLKDYVNDYESDKTKSSHTDIELGGTVTIKVIDPATNQVVATLDGIFNQATGDVTIDTTANSANAAAIAGMANGNYLIRVGFSADSTFDNDKISQVFADINFVKDGVNNGTLTLVNDEKIYQEIDSGEKLINILSNDTNPDALVPALNSQELMSVQVIVGNKIADIKLDDLISIVNGQVRISDIKTVIDRIEATSIGELYINDKAEFIIHYTVGNQTADLKITVNGEGVIIGNDDFVLTNDQFIFEEDSTIQNVNVLLNDTDVNIPANPVVELVPVASYVVTFGNFTTTVSAANITVNPDNTLKINVPAIVAEIESQLNHELVGTDKPKLTVQYRLQGHTEMASVDITINGKDGSGNGNHNPDANPFSNNTNEDTIPVYSLANSASDVDGDTLSFTYVGNLTVTAANGSAPISQAALTALQAALNTYLSQSGNFNNQGSFTLPANAFDSINLGQNVIITFDYSVSDGHGGSAGNTVTLGIDGRDENSGTNHPTIFSIENHTGFIKEVSEASLATTGVLGVIKISDADGINNIINDTDAEVTLTSNKTGFVATLSANDYNIVPLLQNGTEWSYRVELTAAGIAKITGLNGLALSDNLELKIKPKVTDANGNIAEQEFTFKINGDNNGNAPVNHAPDVSDFAFAPVSEDEQFNFNIGTENPATDIDVGDTVTYHLESGSIDVIADGFNDIAKVNAIKAALTANGALVVTSAGLVMISTAAKAVIGTQLNSGENIDIKFNYFAKDNHGLESTDHAGITIKILGENENAAPTAVSVSETFWEDESMNIQLVGNDTDGTISEYVIDINSIVVKNENGANASAAILADVKAMIQSQLSDASTSGNVTLDHSYFEPLLNSGQSFKISFDYKVKDNEGLISNTSEKAEININGKSPHQFNGDELWMYEDSSSIGTDVLLNDVIQPNGHSYTVLFDMNEAITFTIEKNNQITTKVLSASEWNPYITCTGSVDAIGLSEYFANHYGIDIGVNEDGYSDQIRYNMDYIVQDDITLEVLGGSTLAVYIDGVNN